MVPPTIYIEPGGHWDASFSGTTYVERTMPLECHHDPQSAPATCDQRVILPAGSYVALGTAHTAIDCNDASGCSCQPDASGSCEFPYGGPAGGDTLSAQVSFEFPSESQITVTFD